MPTIYAFTKPGDYLKAAWEEKKEKNPHFSLRSWARVLGLKSNAPLSFMLQNKRAIPQYLIPKIVESLNLSSKEALYLETLNQYEKAKEKNSKEFYSQRLKSLTPSNKLTLKELDFSKFFSRPLHVVLCEIVALKNFKSDLSWIQKRLRLKTTQMQIKLCLERLVNLKLIKEDKGKFERGHEGISSYPDVSDEVVKEYHKNVSQWAEKAVFQQDVSEREFNGYAFNIQKKDMKLAKEMIREFSSNFIAALEAKGGEGEETYQLNVQFFKLTKESE